MNVYYLIYRALTGPLEAVYMLLIFILSMQMNATPLELTVLAAAKPIVSLLAFQVNGVVTGKPERIRLFLYATSLLASLPCFLFLYTNNIWYYIASYALFTTAIRAALPVWIEILKNHLNEIQLAAACAKGSALNYSILVIIPIFIGSCMDSHPEIWKSFFCGFAFIQLINLIAIALLPLPKHSSVFFVKIRFQQWRSAWNLFKTTPNFANYHLLFFAGGVGLVAIQPILPLYFKESLQLSYTQLTLALSVCKGFAFVASSPFWVKLSSKTSLFLLNGWVNAFSLLFLFFMAMASYHISSVFIAYVMYGFMQAGCESSWNLSGPFFAKKKESILYSSINLACVGIRGCICPFLGIYIYNYLGSQGIFLFAGLICFLSLGYALKIDLKTKFLSYSTKDLPI